MAEPPNILVVSDLHFGEELLPGRPPSAATRSSSAPGVPRVPALPRVRRIDGRPWRLVIAGDLFDFMSVVVPGTRELPGADGRRAPLRPRPRRRGRRRAHARDLRDAAAAARRHGAGSPPPVTRSTSSSATTTSSCSRPRSSPSSSASSRAAGADDRAMSRIRVVPWFVYVPGVAWIEHGHVYDEGCSFEFNLAPMRSQGRQAHLQRRLRGHPLPRRGGARDRSARHRGVELLGLHPVRAGAGRRARSAGSGSRTRGSSWSLFRARTLHQSLQAPRPPPPRAPRAPRPGRGRRRPPARDRARRSIASRARR